MDFQHSERAQKVMAQVQRFLDERILPNEQTYIDHASSGRYSDPEVQDIPEESRERWFGSREPAPCPA